MTALGARIAALTAAGQQAVRSGLVQASGGNLSVRLADESDEFVITSSGAYLDQLGPSTLTRMHLDGTVLDASSPSSEWKLHQQVYLRRPDVQAIVHVHPQYALILDELGEPIRLHTLDHVAYTPKINRIPFYPNGSDELGFEAGKAMADADCLILGHHGCSTTGPDMPMAYRRAEVMEHAAQFTYRLLLAGNVTAEFPQELRATAIHR